MNSDETNNGKGYDFPLTDVAVGILERRKANVVNEFVFGYPASDTGHIPKDCQHH